MTRLANVSVGGTITAADTNATRQMVNKTMQLVTPTSVSTGTIGTYGAVTVSAATAVSINGCFTTEYDWYEIVLSLTTSGSANISATLRLAGTDASTSYDRQIQRGLNATNTVAQSLNQTSWVLNASAVTGLHVGKMRLFGPAIAAATTGLLEYGTTANPMTSTDGAIYNSMLLHRTTTAYDGVTLTPSAGTITGAIRVYGII